MRQNSKEWLEMRKKYIGASDAPIIMQVCKWKVPDGRLKTPYLLWQEKTGIADFSMDSAATRYGKEMEEPARQAYEQLVDHIVSPDIVFHPEHKFMMASLDGLSLDKTRAVEIKNAGKDDHETALNGRVPDHYYPQVQHQVEILFRIYNITQIDYFSYHKGEGIIVTVDRDEEYIARMLEKEIEFWRCVQDLDEPELTDADFVERDNAWQECASRLWEVKQEKRALQTEEKALEAMLKDYSEGVNSRAGGYRYTKSTIPGRVDYKAIPELLNMNLDGYRKKPTERWTLKNELGRAARNE